MSLARKYESDLSLPSRSTREGRRFALTLAGGFLLFALLGYWRRTGSVAVVALSLSAISFLAAMFIPGRLDPIRRAWMRLGDAIGYLTTPVLMAIVYYIVLTPLAIARRAVAARPTGKDSYWHLRPPLPPPARMERQF